MEPLARCAEHCQGANALRVWEVNLEKDLLLHVGRSGWVSIDQTRVDSSLLSILPHQRLDGMHRSGADVLELNQKGERSLDDKFLLARLKEATELLPGTYLRHVPMSSLLTITVGEVKDFFYVGTGEDEPRGTSNSNQFDLLSGRTYPPATLAR